MYAACLKYHTTTDYTPEHIHELGLQEVARITKRLEAVQKQVSLKLFAEVKGVKYFSDHIHFNI